MSKRALVTGASSGIGRAFALQLAKQGYRVAVVARREDRLQALLLEMQGTGHELIVADLASASGVQAVSEAIEREACHLLVNNAGYSLMQPFYDTPLEDQKKVLQVNCDAVVSLSHTFLRQANAGDALINVASVVAFMPTPAQAMYSASKAFIASFSECLWEEQRHRRVYVMALCPGITQTEFIQTATGGESDGQNLPAAMTQSSDDVVSEALKALKKRKKAVVVTGRVNRAMLQIPRMMSRQGLLKMLAVAGDPKRAL